MIELIGKDYVAIGFTLIIIVMIMIRVYERPNNIP
jgi:hypothetical protein